MTDDERVVMLSLADQLHPLDTTGTRHRTSGPVFRHLWRPRVGFAAAHLWRPCRLPQFGV